LTAFALRGQPHKEDDAMAGIDPAALDHVTQELALRIGPIAGILVRRTAPQCKSIEELYLKVAEEIDSPVEREKFLRARTAVPAAPSKQDSGPRRASRSNPEPARPAPNLVAEAAGAGASILPPPSEVQDSPSQTAVLVSAVRAPSRTGYLYLAGGIAVLVIVVSVHVARFAPGKGEGAASTPPTASDARTAESTAARTNAPAPAGVPAKSKALLPPPGGRVRISEEVSGSLLLEMVKPDYPLLARQAHVQGMVVLDADISKDGVVEAVRLVSGHPTLVPAAEGAAKQWKYKPFLLNGKAVPVSTHITVNFKLSPAS
jgi:TonB family protein